ncbi:Uma2 family endonuclease [Catellatospora vulcania]|uniref:Uma2 family endonuclease n=1 Tax=Catellatospora vulcania TaxID=1460450 RepID=UPI0012D44C7C|nr:Uma2 family endonuclease [Catellatospora vulcania]
MSAAVAKLAQLRPGVRGYTVADLHTLPEVGPRYELLDGSIVMSPSATSAHNMIARWIAQLIEDADPGDGYVVSTDQSVAIDDHNEPRPDIVVLPAAHIDDSPFPVDGVQLVVEVVSPTSALRDTEVKRVLYARAGVPFYWVVVPDPDADAIALAELVLEGGKYRYATHYTSGVFRTEQPWPVEIDLPALAARTARYRRPSVGTS